MYAPGHTVTDAVPLPLNLPDAIRAYEADTSFTAMQGEEVSAAIATLKHGERNSYMAHFSA